MKLSVIIVNYNVKHFLEQCINSVLIAGAKIESFEIIVVDNKSVDGSVAMIADKFPQVKLITNRHNVGFSAGNNQGINESGGAYILLLNPDTVVEEDTFLKCINFMDENPDGGGLGVKMIDGNGNFLPESKRGLPTPSVALFKMIGLSSLFPKSRLFNKYHLGNLDKDKVHKIDVLSGAFMLLRKSVLDKIGLLDESFFMYGEDIDLSYRITQGGYSNYYFPETRIIHYKGESTKKGSLNYVFIFYDAMLIFAQKHFTRQNAKAYTWLLKTAIYLRASIAVLTRVFYAVILPVIDSLILFGGLVLITKIWEQQIVFPDGGTYPEAFLTFVVPTYISIWLLSILISGGYDKPVKYSKILQGILMGSLVILVGYALAPDDWRFSRALIIIGAAYTALSMATVRILMRLLKLKFIIGETDRSRKILIVGSKAEFDRVATLLSQTEINYSVIGYIAPQASDEQKNTEFLGILDNLEEVVNVYKANEVIFCSKDISANQIIDQMAKLDAGIVNHKIAPPESLHIIGSSYVNSSGSLYVIDVNSITKPGNLRSKRIFDLLGSIIAILLSPILIFVVYNPIKFFGNILAVMTGRLTWVGYINIGFKNKQNLPTLRAGVLNPADRFELNEMVNENLENINLLYAKDYSIINDFKIVIRGLRNLGR
ncbi:MAG TPA: glycosyltransferase [Flavobacteriales bacterium]|nr:glycosyltransferase [Flavobacteriales bacterium]HIA12725.1 glycosyltransferase [Flavobacteriales bacterium]HIO72639.1 glycosyltransferase [Flavobacteriales bacterium]